MEQGKLTHLKVTHESRRKDVYVGQDLKSRIFNVAELFLEDQNEAVELAIY